ncbi:BRO family protein [Acinetobacter baumannii]|uniref:BRO-N domain-containing protein n=1 Tax=Acinetobacter baumannii TaxID=470 RepID=UPI0020372EED|nr:BRO family protein [Acinetobacter baumannii]MCL6184292.1 phage antirepressor protein [Acinetobacter baumannii]MCL6191010.1 phage antirepressor protein [Acinetobacter baumannii]MDC4500988.1 BRO family protein [Acinetobacter baumannii]MDC4727112.1 BRO family protein [Acinetobacter baumannii]MDC5147180.1 BRO family protein [Acinetobacter baumannii]
MNAISNFTFHNDYNVRVQLIDAEPWFCLADVCCVLSVDRTSRLLRDLDEKGLADCHTPTNGGNQKIKFVNEPNLYRIIFRSNKPEAKQFQDWVFNEVLPTIRKTGKYEAPKPVEKRNYLNNSDMNNIKRLIWTCADHFGHKGSFNQAIWACLRDVTGVPSPAKFEVEHLPVLAEEFKRILNIVQPFLDMQYECQTLLIKRVIRGRADHTVLQALLDNMRNAANQSDNQLKEALQKQLPATFNQECLNLINRRPNHYDHYEYNERLI